MPPKRNKKSQEKPNLTHIRFKVVISEKTVHSSCGHI